jgi:hypothetical protein
VGKRPLHLSRSSSYKKKPAKTCTTFSRRVPLTSQEIKATSRPSRHLTTTDKPVLWKDKSRSLNSQVCFRKGVFSKPSLRSTQCLQFLEERQVSKMNTRALQGCVSKPLIFQSWLCRAKSLLLPLAYRAIQSNRIKSRAHLESVPKKSSRNLKS